MPRLVLFCLASVFLPSLLHGQAFSSAPCNEDEGNTHNGSWFSGSVRLCELRRVTLPLVDGKVNVSGKNGGISVLGEDRRDIALEARVVVQAGSRDEARDLAREIKIDTAGTIQAEGPTSTPLSRRSWYVNYTLHVPRHLAATLRTQNGGIDIRNIDGVINAETTNGGLTLDRLAGDVHASTVNGGVDAKLEGSQWRGAGLFAKSTNGGVSLNAPDGYSAHLIADTVNGGIAVGFPVTVQGQIRNHLDTTLGRGGPTVRLQTTNGGVSIDKL